MESVRNWGEAISNSLIEVWEVFLSAIPAIIGALLVFFVGLFVASFLGKAVEKFVGLLKIGKFVDRSKMAAKINESGVRVDFARFAGGVVKWFMIIVFLMAATDIVGLTQITSFLESILLYIPNVVIAIVVLAVSFMVGDFVSGLVKSSTKIAEVGSANLLASLAKWAIVVFGLLAALVQLGIAESLANVLFTGIVAAISLAVGLSFGLGGREEAALILKKLREKITVE